jgi:hypothetical protein
MVRDLIRFAAAMAASGAVLLDRAADAFTRLEYRYLVR